MANPTTGFGFRWTRDLSGGAPTVQGQQFKILSSYGTAIYRGDPVIFNAGYVQVATSASVTILGVFWGCRYTSTSMKQPRWSNYWPGSDSATTSLDCWVDISPFSVFEARCDGTNIGQASVGQNIAWASGTGSTSTGNSGYLASSTNIDTTSTRPFRVIGIGPYKGLNESSTTANNLIEVVFNNQFMRNLTAV